jgi:hypothetical protein
LRSAISLTRHTFGLSWPATLQGAWLVLRANQLWAPFPDNDPDGARRAMRRFYELVARKHGESFDPTRAAELEVEWWRVHREHQRGPDDVDEGPLIDALSALYAYVYGVDQTDVTLAAEQRALAMRYSDQWVEEGCHLESPLVPAERAALVRSYKRGQRIGGDFRHIPGCTSAREPGCVIAFSTFDGPVPANSRFGRTTATGLQVLCTNPAALGGGAGIVDPIFPSAPFAPGSTIALANSLLHLTQPRPATVWSELPGAYTARCSTAGGASALEVGALHGAQVPRPSPDATWGLHLLDANVALGNLVSIVGSEASAFTAAAHP